MRGLKFYNKNNFCQSLLLKNHLKSDFFNHKLNSRKRGNSLSVFTEIQRLEVNSTELNGLKFHGERNTGLCAITDPSYKVTTKQTLTTSKHGIEFSYSFFPCRLKVSRNKFGLTNRRRKCKKGKRLTIIANF